MLRFVISIASVAYAFGEVHTFDSPLKGSIDLTLTDLVLSPSGGTKRRPAPIGLVLTAQSKTDGCKYDNVSVTVTIEGARNGSSIEANFNFTLPRTDWLAPERFEVLLPEEFRSLVPSRTTFKIEYGAFDCQFTSKPYEVPRIDWPKIKKYLEPGKDCEFERGQGVVVIGSNLDSYTEFYRAKGIDDKFGLAELVAAGRIMLVSRDEKLKVLSLNDERVKQPLLDRLRLYDLQMTNYHSCVSRSSKGQLNEPISHNCKPPRFESDEESLQTKVVVEVRILSGPLAGKKGVISAAMISPVLAARELKQ